MSERERVEAEARRLYPDAPADEVFWINELRGAFIAGRTVTAEQVEAAAERSRQIDTGEARGDMRHVLRAAGLLIEGEDHG